MEEGGRYNVIYAEMISHHDDYHVSFTSATCCKDHISPYRIRTDKIDTETTIMNNHASFHTSHVLYRTYQTKKKRNEKERKEIYY